MTTDDIYKALGTRSPTAAEDADLLRRAIAGKLSDEQREAFEDMLEKMGDRGLTEKQRSWVKGVLDEPEYENLVSSGKVPRGKDIPTPAVLQNLPKRPPTRKVDD